MIFVLTLFSFLAGTILGSFLNVLIDRLSTDRTVLWGRSKCESCNHVLLPLDLIPIVSYVALLGRCRYCHVKIPIRLLLVEVSSGALVSLLVLYSIFAGLTPILLIFLLIIMLSFLGVFFADMTYGVIPDEFNAAIVGFSLLWLTLENPASIPVHFYAGLASFFLFFCIYLLTHGKGMGFGDVKLAFAIGLFLGLPLVVVGLYAAFLTGAVVSLILVVVGLKKMRGGTIAFGPFLSIGAALAYFFGTNILNFFI